MGKELTAKHIEHMKPGSKRMEVPAGDGLYLVVHPTGKKAWMFRYRHRGRTRGMTLSKPYPDLGLAAARAEAEAAQKQLDADIDPAIVQAEEQKQEEPNTAKSVGEEWISRYVRPNTRTWPEVERILKREVFTTWRDKYIHEIGKSDVLRLLDALVDRPAPVLANRMLSIFKRWFRWCVERGYIDQSPVVGIRPPTTEKSRDRVLTSEELTAIWEAAPDIGFPFGPYFRMLILTGQRRNEVSDMEWSEIDGTLWTLSKARTKPGRIHDVPLSVGAMALLDDVPRFKAERDSEDENEKKGRFVFTTTSGKRPVSGFSKAKRALDTAILERRKQAAIGSKTKVKALDNWTIHDLRRTMSTWMGDNRISIHVLAAILNHSPGSTMGITGIYAKNRWSKEKREALEAWSAYVLSLELSKEKTA